MSPSRLIRNHVLNPEYPMVHSPIRRPRHAAVFIVLSLLAVTRAAIFAQEASPTAFVKVLDEQHFPEGPAWDGHKNLFASSCYGGWISIISPDSSGVFLRAGDSPFTLAKTNGLTFGPDGALYACDFGVGAVLRIAMDGKSEIVAAGYQGQKFNRPNDLAFDPRGALYFTDPHSYDRNKPDGAVYRLDLKNRKVTLVAAELAFPNGIAFSADGRWLYVCESARERILRFRVGRGGKLHDRNVFIELHGGDPDGIAFDTEGNLYVAHFGGGAIHIISPDGKLAASLSTPGKKPSNLEFAGPDLTTLYVTEDETNAIYKLEVKVPGLRLFGLK
jgi:gluconolactonase